MSAGKIIGFIVAGIFVIFGCLWVLASTSKDNTNPGGTFITGLLLIGIGLTIIFAIKLREPKPVQKIEVTTKSRS